MQQTRYIRFILVAGLFALGIFFSLYKLTESPPVWYDEGWYIQTSANWASTGIDGIQLSPGHIQRVPILTVQYPLLYPLSLWFKAFGESILAARSLMVLFIIGFLAASYFFVRRLFGSGMALGALALLVTFPPLYGNGKSVLGEVPGLLYLVLFLLSYTRARSSVMHRTGWLVLAGVFAGLCMTTKPVFLLLAPAIALGMYIEWKRGAITAKDIGIGALSVLVPFATWFWIQFYPGASASQVLTFYANPYHIGDITAIVLKNLRRLFSDVGTLYTVFLMFVWSTAFFVRRREQERVSVQEIIAFSFSVLVVIAYLRTAGVYRYLFYAQGTALLFFLNALIASCRYLFGQAAVQRARFVSSAFVIMLCVLGLYQVGFNSWVAESYGSHKTAFWEEYFSHIPGSTSVFFYDTPEVVPFIPNRNYYQFLLAPAGGSTGSEELSVVKSGVADIVIVATDTFTADTNNTFAAYVPSEQVYKYFILTKRAAAWNGRSP